MNDGAGRISPSLMRKIRDVLGLPTIPSAVQGRLGSAKGMWLVDVKDQSNEDWIETYPTQRKWQCDMSDEAHRTLEVRSWSTELNSASLNIQFLPILEDRARDPLRMRATFFRNMTNQSEEELQDLKRALQHPELFRKWIREGSQPSFQQLTSRSVPFLGGLPENYEDIMSFLVDGGFEPMRLKFLQELVFQKQKMKGDAMKEELKIKIAKSTYAYILVDFWGVLEEDEVHLCFSSKFNDGTEELSDLDGRDILVARSPAHLPSDIQKVRAVFKPELRHLRDVIIFSSKGDMPLAAQLSGGDYDGDKSWICWDPDIVNNFHNHSLPPKPDFSPYLAKDFTKLVENAWRTRAIYHVHPECDLKQNHLVMQPRLRRLDSLHDESTTLQRPRLRRVILQLVHIAQLHNYPGGGVGLPTENVMISNECGLTERPWSNPNSNSKSQNCSPRHVAS